MRRSIDLRYDIYPELTGLFDKALKLILRIPQVRTCQILLVLKLFIADLQRISVRICQVSAFFHSVIFQTECRICCHRIFFVLEPDQVVVQMYLEIIHLIP